jgi:hypothetical protein
MTDEKADPLQTFLRLCRVVIPTIALLLVVLQWWQSAQLMDEANSANQTMRQIWSNHPPAFPLDTLASAVYLPAAVSPVAAFDAGEGPWQAQSVWMQLARAARAQDHLGYDVFPSGRQIGLNAAMFCQIIIPCLALILGWHQVRKSRGLNLQSWASLQTSLIEYAGPTVALSCLLTAALQRQSLGLEGAIRLMLILGIYILYSVAAGTICWLVYQRSTSLSRSTGLLVLFWLFNFSLARPFTVNLAAAVFPLPSLDQFARKLEFESQNGYNGVDPRADRQRRFFAEALRDYKVSSAAEMPVNLSAILLQKEERHQREVAYRLRGEVNALFHAQERLEQSLSMFMPLVAIQISSSAIAATDFASERWQLEQATVFWDKVVKRIYDDIVTSSGPMANKVLRGSDYWQQIPMIELQVPSPILALNASLLPALGLSFISIFGMVTAMRARKTEVSTQPTEESAL